MHNLKYLSNLSSFKYDINEFADATFAEFYEINTLKGPTEYYDRELLNIKIQKVDFNVQNDKTPAAFDWRDQEGYVTSVKNQASCGSCYAFAVLGAFESFIFNKTGKSVDLSEQEIIDCGRGYYTAGCNGGSDMGVISYIKTKGIGYESDYPYKAKRDFCKTNETNHARVNVTFNKIVTNDPGGNEYALMQQLLKHGPVITAVDHLHESFMRYKSGIYYEPDCNNSNRYSSHSVLLVGFGRSEDGVDYWTIKNSFGKEWGESGYFRIARNRNNHCMIASESYSIT